MKFARVEMLFLIWTLPVLFLVFLYGMKRRKKILARFASVKGLETIAAEARGNRRWLKAVLFLCAMGFMALSLSGPRYGYRWQEVERKGVDIIIALDCSKSMLAQDIKPTRLDRAKRKIYDLLTLLQGDRVGLVAFAGTAFLQCPLTLDYEAFYIFLSSLTPDFLPIGGTDISGAVSTAAAGFDPESNSEKAVILITDGENTGPDDPVEAATAAQKAGVKLFCIGVGGEEGVPVPDGQGGFKKDENGRIAVTKLDENLLKKMAVITGGTYVRSVTGDMDLNVIYTDEIRGKMEKTTLESGKKQVWEDRYQWPLAIAILLLMIEIFLPTRRTAAVLIIGLAFCFAAPPVYADAFRDGVSAYEKGEYEKAKDLFIKAQLDDPDNPAISYNLGAAYYKMEEYDSAALNFQAALNTEENALKQKSLYNLGNARFRQQKYEEAIKHYEDALTVAETALHTDDIQARQNIAFVKKVMEEQQKSQENQQGENKDGDQQQKDSEQQKEGDQPSDKSEKNQEGQENKEDGQPEKGQEQQASNPEDSQEKSGEQGPPEPSVDENKKEGEEKPMQAAKPGEKGDEGDKAQAERVLNRLKDQPGRAMMPHYQKRQVEKDW
jgi:Ca-activated chloride channel family protein